MTPARVWREDDICSLGYRVAMSMFLENLSPDVTLMAIAGTWDELNRCHGPHDSWLAR